MSEEGEFGELRTDLRKQYEAIFSLKEESGANIFPIFNVLPIKKDYPDYYAIIKNPISLNTLKKRLPHYTSPQDYVNDVSQIPWNAKTYNSKGSLIYIYADILEKFLRNVSVPQLQAKYTNVNYPNLGPLPDEIEEMKKKEAMMKIRTASASPVALGNANEVPARSRSNSPLPLTSMSNTPQPVTEVKQPIPQQNGGINGYNTSRQNMAMQGNNSTANRRMEQTVISMGPSRVPMAQISSRVSPHPILPNRSMSSTPISHSPGAILKPSIQQRLQTRRGRPPIIDLPYLLRIKNIMKMIKREVDDNNQTLTLTFEKLPDPERHPAYRQIISNPVCLDDIRRRVKTRKYKNFGSFQDDFTLMIENYKKYNQNNPMLLNTARLMEYHFRKLVEIELSKPDSDFLPEGELRYPLENIEVRGKIYEIGDWVLLNNANDPNKPVVAQIFKLWYTSDGTKWLNACWYFRPEQTVHRVDRLFYKNEVVKTGQYRDHLINDLIGKCYVVHFTRYQRGNPATPYEGPLFICEFRYNESDKVFNKIRTWKACLPEELRDQDEETIPVNGRKFFKYPSPIRHLLRPDATPHDRIPEPTEGDPTAPPLVGAVYLRPKVERDDLGEYSTSDDCPRYIIRPGDPPESGIIDEVHGTIITSMQTANALPRTSQSTSRLPALKQTKSAASNENMAQPTKGMSYQKPIPPVASNRTMQSHKVPVSTLPQRPEQTIQPQKLSTVEALRQGPIPTNISSVSLNEAVNDMSQQAAKSGMRYVTIDVPHSYVLPMAGIPKHNEVMTTDDANRLRGSRYQANNSQSEILWFRGPSISIKERYVDSMNSFNSLDLNRLTVHKKRKLDYEEIEEQGVDTHMSIDDKGNVTTEASPEGLLTQGNDMHMDSAHQSDDDDDNAEEEGHLSEKLISTSTIGLRPSAKFIIHKHKYSTIENIIT